MKSKYCITLPLSYSRIGRLGELLVLFSVDSLYLHALHSSLLPLVVVRQRDLAAQEEEVAAGLPERVDPGRALRSFKTYLGHCVFIRLEGLSHRGTCTVPEFCRDV